MNENEFTVTFITEDAGKGVKCIGCVAYHSPNLCDALPCFGRNVRFKIKES
jgi:hypothetical protein